MFGVAFVSCCGVVLCVSSTGTRCKVLLCSLEGKVVGERAACSYFVVVSCCGVVVCVWYTGTRCKAVLCLLEGKASDERTVFVCHCLLWCAGLCVVHRHEM